MAQQIGIDGALLHAQAETRGENILKLHPEESGVQFFGFHGRILEKRKEMRTAETKVTPTVQLRRGQSTEMTENSNGREDGDKRRCRERRLRQKRKTPRTASGRSFLRVDRIRSAIG